MPLLTNDIFQARSAYAVLEVRAQAAEQAAASLKATVDNLSATQQSLAQAVSGQGQYTATQAQTNAQLTAQQAQALVPVSPDLTLDSFIASLGLAVALAEASMPDRAINSVTASVQSYVTFSTGPDGVSKVVGLRLYQPELGAPTALATTSFEIAKVTPQPGAPPPRSLYTVLQYKQSVFADPFWTKFVTGSPPSPPAGQIVAEIVKVFANIGAWSFPYLIQEAATIAGLETTLSTLIGAPSPPPQITAYATAVGALSNLTQALATRSNFVAGDLYALTAALDATTRIADTLRS